MLDITVAKRSGDFHLEASFACEGSGVTAIWAVIMRQTKPSSRIKRNRKRLRRSRLPSRLPLESFAGTSSFLFDATSVYAFLALTILQRWKDHAECTADSFLAEDLDVSPMCLDNCSGDV